MARVHARDAGGGDVTIDAYLGALERSLPRISRRRALAEAQEHLRDSAARHHAGGLIPHEAEAAAVADFGPVEVVARRLAAERALRDTRYSSLVVLGAVVFFVFPLYVVPENSLPPATWTEKPNEIFVLQIVSLAIWLGAGALAASGVAFAWTGWSHLAAPVLVTASVAVAGASAAIVALTVRWISLTPSTPNWPLATALALGCLVICVATSAWALAHRRLLVQE